MAAGMTLDQEWRVASKIATGSPQTHGPAFGLSYRDSGRLMIMHIVIDVLEDGQ